MLFSAEPDYLWIEQEDWEVESTHLAVTQILEGVLQPALGLAYTTARDIEIEVCMYASLVQVSVCIEKFTEPLKSI